jgi:hypothetical protein
VTRLVMAIVDDLDVRDVVSQVALRDALLFLACLPLLFAVVVAVLSGLAEIQ